MSENSDYIGAKRVLGLPNFVAVGREKKMEATIAFVGERATLTEQAIPVVRPSFTPTSHRFIPVVPWHSPESFALGFVLSWGVLCLWLRHVRRDDVISSKSCT